MEISFKNKVVLVTGASAGIGESIALLFAKYEAKLALVGRSESSLWAAAASCEELSGETPLVVFADLSTDEGCELVANKTIDHFGKLDILVNNAGVGARTTIQTTDMAMFDRVFNLNVRGVYNLTRLLVPHLIKTKGNIVNISSISGTKVSVGSLPYSMTKAALDHFTRLVALELAPTGVRVNAVLPGFTVSKFVTRMTNYSEKEYKDWLNEAKSGIPMREVCTGEDVAQAVLHLASDRSRLVTGALLPVDGGALFGEFGNLMERQIALCRE
ncbi:3-oxoacyl-[acyl-carrier-protein] reductase FabG-like [Plodia interpunctella]|uniref:3-oxoacyl-[acyl-carrier-protein] reductase FabG-like n=1 Tax=Plodia interpunctella TaxID=58824 RepID=UPI002367C547|nr:3-oxoacyl-[acyl-carrier-protein] reductase FabG-like [Plodia interpunctella]